MKPSDAAKIVTATKYALPLNLRKVHAFHEKIEDLIRYKLNLSLLASPQTPTLKDKLFKRQRGLCWICDKPVDFENLLLKSVHIHHIDPVSKGGNKYKLSNLALTHI